jgi:hypothetical protein
MPKILSKDEIKLSAYFRMLEEFLVFASFYFIGCIYNYEHSYLISQIKDSATMIINFSNATSYHKLNQILKNVQLSLLIFSYLHVEAA